jgi:hypothetical protein
LPKIQFGFDEYQSGPNPLVYPKSAKEFMPEWYKSLSRSVDIKRCMPFLDGMISGYIAELVRDVNIEIVNGEQISDDDNLIRYRKESSTGFMAQPHGHNKKHFVWRTPFVIKTDPGYSVLITHPFNRFDLPFTTLSAIVDADGLMPGGDLPFFLKEGFHGVIKAGTPIFQILPFKRESWNAENTQDLIDEAIQINKDFDRSTENFYRDTRWNKKEYN